MIVERNDESIIEGERKIPLFVINYGTTEVQTWIMAKIEQWNCLLKKSNAILRQIITKKWHL